MNNTHQNNLVQLTKNIIHTEVKFILPMSFYLLTQIEIKAIVVKN